MAVAETAKLIVDLSLKGNFTGEISKANKSLSTLNQKITDTQGRAYKAGQQIGTGIKRGAIIAVAAVGTLTALFIRMAKEGQEAANVQKVFAQAVANSTKVSAAQVKALDAQQQALLELAGVDDELIKTEQTRLIQMGLTGDQVLKLTPAILDLSKATGIDLLTATKLAGKAAEGNTTALQRYGIIIDKAKAKTHPFGATLDALNKKFGGTMKALSGSLNVKLDVLREKLANVREEAGQALLPVLTRITDVVAKSLVPAFSNFIRAILPGVVSGLNQIADFLESGGAAKTFASVFNTIKTAAPILQKSAEATFAIVKAAVDLFTSLPPEIQNLAVGAFAINKLTGGLVTNVAGGIFDFLKNTRGSTPANPLFVANVTGGLPGVGGPGGGNGLPTLLLKALPFLAVASGAAAQGINNVETTGRLNPLVNSAEDKLLAAIHQNTDAIKGNGLANPILDRGGREAGTPGFIGKITSQLRALTDTTKLLSNAFLAAANALKHAKTDLERRTAARQATGLVQAGRGNVENTSAVLAGLRKALHETHDPKTAALLRESIAKVERKLAGREFAARQIAIANKALADGKLTRSETAAVKRAVQALKDRGLPAAAAGIEAAVRKNRPVVTVNLPRPTVSIRAFTSGFRVATNFSGGNGGVRVLTQS